MDLYEQDESAFRMGVDLTLQLCQAGRKNIGRTHTIFKITFGILFLASALYMTGFVSPYWVVASEDVKLSANGNNNNDEDHDEMDDYMLDNDNSNNISGSDDSLGPHKPHGGIWEKCLETRGVETCHIFHEDLDSVVAMLGCVGAACLVGAWLWSGFVCLRKPDRSRYVATSVAAIIGGIFGLVCIFMFVGVQGKHSYSWAFALTLVGSVLGLSAAGLNLLGIAKALQGGILRTDSDVPSIDLNGNFAPQIIVTGATLAQRQPVGGRSKKKQKSREKRSMSWKFSLLSPAGLPTQLHGGRCKANRFSPGVHFEKGGHNPEGACEASQFSLISPSTRLSGGRYAAKLARRGANLTRCDAKLAGQDFAKERRISNPFTKRRGRRNTPHPRAIKSQLGHQLSPENPEFEADWSDSYKPLISHLSTMHTSQDDPESGTGNRQTGNGNTKPEQDMRPKIKSKKSSKSAGEKNKRNKSGQRPNSTASKSRLTLEVPYRPPSSCAESGMGLKGLTPRQGKVSSKQKGASSTIKGDTSSDDDATHSSEMSYSPGLSSFSNDEVSPQVVPTSVLFRTPETRRRSEVFYIKELHRTPEIKPEYRELESDLDYIDAEWISPWPTQPKKNAEEFRSQPAKGSLELTKSSPQPRNAGLEPSKTGVKPTKTGLEPTESDFEMTKTIQLRPFSLQSVGSGDETDEEFDYHHVLYRPKLGRSGHRELRSFKPK